MNLSEIQSHPAYLSSPKIDIADTAQPMESTANNSPAPSFDKYVPEESDARLSAGLYYPTHDESGHPQVQWEPPVSLPADEPASEEPEMVAPTQERPDSRSESCTANTDRVDREIEKLKREKQQLEQQLRSAPDSPKAEEWTRQLSRIEQQLSQKDNDAYRRQHTVFS
ncbi:MAG: hypothetical protein HFJ80_00590 [Clostridiales bacterium]|nr:hypothetical protein [Clostridiales bacterium]